MNRFKVFESYLLLQITCRNFNLWFSVKHFYNSGTVILDFAELNFIIKKKLNFELFMLGKSQFDYCHFD